MIEGEDYSVICREADMLGDDFTDEKKVRLNRVISEEKSKFTYEYDFGDGWGHTILVEKIFRPLDELEHPICLKGKRSAPPEDCGGTGGYYHLLKALRDPNHPEHADMQTWAGYGYSLEYFDADIAKEDQVRGGKPNDLTRSLDS